MACVMYHLGTTGTLFPWQAEIPSEFIIVVII